MGIDQNPICIARCMLIYEMMKRNASNTAIFEVWYLSCLSKETLFMVKESLMGLMKQTDLQPEVYTLFENWCCETISVQKCIDLWFEHAKDSSDHYVLPNLVSEEQRVSYARYYMTGIFKSEDVYVQGNATMFSLPAEGFDYIKVEDNLFTSISLGFISSVKTQNLVEYIITKLGDLIGKLKLAIQSGKIICEYKVLKLDINDTRATDFIASLNPYQIDWSNIPDYIHQNDFI